MPMLNFEDSSARGPQDEKKCINWWVLWVKSRAMQFGKSFGFPVEFPYKTKLCKNF